ncbi:MAG: hypothetical protein RLZZ271_1233 [Pseudomonadota bacterium]|jgi:glutaredoxin
MPIVHRLFSCLTPSLLAVFAALCALPASAQQIYRIVGPDGKVTFTDKPPVADGRSRISTVASSIPAGTANTANLPFELQAVANKYPVTFYSTDNCAICSLARSYLVGRGIPFAEKTVNSQEEIDAFIKIAGGTKMPLLTVGPQKISNFSEAEWSQALTAAAYPANSVLPANYKYAAAAPIIAPKAGPANAPEAASEPPEERAPAPSVIPTAPGNPAGIRF